MKVVIDMNLSPAWVSLVERAGHTAKHWSSVGSPNAADREILGWARRNDYVVFTHDLDFGAILAATCANAPSVVQIRTQDPTPSLCAELLFDILRRYAQELSAGALISVDEDRARVHLLPLKRDGI
jgi:predicted nuclease of predicted toxin-antitoxin system